MISHMRDFDYSKLNTGLLAVVFLLAAVSSGCGGAGRDQADGRPVVVTTTTMIEDLARVIGGEDMRIVGIMRSGEDPHLYDVKPRDATTIRNADLVLMNGLHLEATLKSIIDQHATGPVIAMAEHEDIKPLTGGEELAVAPDPHCWMDVDRYRLYVEQTRDAMIELMPEKKDLFHERAGAYLRELELLDGWIREQFQSIPPGQRVIVTGHDAFAYFGLRYEVQVHGLIGISTEQEPKPQDIEKLKALIQSNGIRAVFPESSLGGSLLQLLDKVARDSGAVVGGTLYSDSLGEPGTEAGTYLGMMRHNTATIVHALRGGGEAR